MSQQGPLPFLHFGDVEICNGARVIEYLRRGLADTAQGHYILGPGEMCGVLYRGDLGTCSSPAIFTSPSVDPAPWYDPAEPGSQRFLGLHLLDIDPDSYSSPVVRTVTQRLSGLGGGTLSAEYLKPRTWKFTGALISADDEGAEYGMRWLTSVLSTTQCDTCETNTLTVRLVCPPGDCSDDEVGLWYSYDVALVDGPHETKNGPGQKPYLGGCRDWVEVEFTMIAANPWLYKPAEVCLPETGLQDCSDDCVDDICEFLSGADTAPCCEVDAPARGVDGAIFTFRNTTSTPFGEIQLESRANCNDEEPLLALLLSSIPSFSTVVVDSSRHTITVIDDEGNETDGQYLIELPDGMTIQWIEVADCEDAACLCARSLGGSPGDAVTVEISIQHREKAA